MAFDFPSSPAEGALFQPSGGPLYKFTNGVWTIPSTPPVMSISDTAPANPIPGQLWWRSTDGASFLWFDDGTSKQWTQFNIGTFPEAPNDGLAYNRKSGAWAKALGVTPYIAFAGSAFKDIAIPVDFNEIRFALIGMQNGTAATYVYAQLMVGGSGAPGDPLVGGTPLTPGGNYAGTLSLVAGATCSSNAWASNIPLGGSAAINTPHGGRLTLRDVDPWVEVDAQTSYATGAGNLLSTGYVLTAGGNVVTGVRFGVTGGTFSAGVVRMFWQ